MSEERRKVTAVYERDEDGVWIVALEEEPRAHTFGRTLERARVNIEETVSLWFDGDVEIVSVVHLPSEINDYVNGALAARADLQVAEEVWQVKSHAAAVRLSKENLSRRDIGQLLLLSHQRVQQILSDAAPHPVDEVTSPAPSVHAPARRRRPAARPAPV